MNWAEILEEKNKRIEELEAQLAEKTDSLGTDVTAERLAAAETELAYVNGLIRWVLETLKSPIELTQDNKLPAVRAVRERLGKHLEKK